MASFGCKFGLPPMALLLCLFLLQFAATGARIPSLLLPSERVTDALKGLHEGDVATNTRPLIGILSQPGDGGKWTVQRKEPVPSDYNTSYIAASYVKFVEAGGARAVPLIYNEPEESLKEKFAAVNGLIFPGGGSSLLDSPFYRTAEKLFNWAIEANDKGDYFPVYGVCLGFELLSVLVSKVPTFSGISFGFYLLLLPESTNTINHSMEIFEAEGEPGPLLFVGDWAKHRSIFQWIPPQIVDKLATQRLAMENHKKGVSPERWESIPALTDFFRVLTVTPDQENKTYISTVEGRKYPVLGVQWHPEKNAYEWGLESIPHTAEAIQVTQSVANFFINEARKSHHKPTSNSEEQDMLIYNYEPFYSARTGKGAFDQAYVFN